MSKDKLYQWFTEHNVKSFSPRMTTVLLDIAKELKPEIITVKDDELRKDLEDYEDALITVCCVAAIHQRAVIARLEILTRDCSSAGI